MSEHAAKRQRTSSQDAAPSYADWQVRKKRSFSSSNAHTAGGARRVDRQDLLLQHEDERDARHPRREPRAAPLDAPVRRTWDWPPPLDDGDQADTPSDDVPDFEASATYQGRRPGRVFKRGDRGQGYYRDRAPNGTAALTGNLSFYPSKTFAGHKPGMVFRRGDRGQGYYRDNPFGGVPVGQKCERYNPHA